MTNAKNKIFTNSNEIVFLKSLNKKIMSKYKKFKIAQMQKIQLTL